MATFFCHCLRLKLGRRSPLTRFSIKTAVKVFFNVVSDLLFKNFRLIFGAKNFKKEFGKNSTFGQIRYWRMQPFQEDSNKRPDVEFGED